ncbi:uncharacterized protein [Symphalangus syndactylus]|uniref:uncharacterized protein n=1 Tax=Symphalangus syndactylus TaxID=9590 RepID=UPI0030054A9B
MRVKGEAYGAVAGQRYIKNERIQQPTLQEMQKESSRPKDKDTRQKSGSTQRNGDYWKSDPTTAQLSPRGSTAQKVHWRPCPLPALGYAEKSTGDGLIQQVLVVRPGECQTLLPARGPTSDPHHNPCSGGARVRDTGSEDGSGSSAVASKVTGQGGHRLPHWVKAAQRKGRAIPGAHWAFSFPWAPRRLRSGSGPGRFRGLLKQARGKVVLVPESPNLRVSNETNTIHRCNLSGFPRPCTVLLSGGL